MGDEQKVGRRSRRRPTPLGAWARGAVSGAVGVAAMDLLRFRQYRAKGGTDSFGHWELAAVGGWDEAPAPAQVGRRLWEGLSQGELPDRTANLVNNVVHWGYGIAWGAWFGVLAASARQPRLRRGPVLGTAVWLTGYAVLPRIGLYQPIWLEDVASLGADWAAHLAYGTVTATTFRLLAAA